MGTTPIAWDDDIIRSLRHKLDPTSAKVSLNTQGRPAMSTTYDVVKSICLGLPETEEFISHGSPSYKVAGKMFATYSVNHHGDGKVALLLNISKDMQKMLVESAPKHFYVPPYSGSQGWVGVELNKGVGWNRVAQLTCDAYRRVAPAQLARQAVPAQAKPPTEKMKPEDIDPYLSKENQRILKKLAGICLELPETTQATQFGSPCFKAGKKTFCNLHRWEGHTELQVWVGADRQVALTSFDDRYRMPAYIGHNGWISFSLAGQPNWREVESMVRASYRHFALKRMLKALLPNPLKALDS